MRITKQQKQRIDKVGKKYDLRFMIIHGSYARGEEKSASDLDVAVYGNKKIEFSRLLDMHGDLTEIFRDSKERELDLKSLHNTNPFFRYEVTRDGRLIYGDENAFDDYCLYAYRDFIDSESLFRLRNLIISKRQEHLSKVL